MMNIDDSEKLRSIAGNLEQLTELAKEVATHLLPPVRGSGVAGRCGVCDAPADKVRYMEHYNKARDVRERLYLCAEHYEYFMGRMKLAHKELFED